MAFPSAISSVADFAAADGTSLTTINATWISYTGSAIITATGQGKLSATTYAEYGYAVSAGPDVEGYWTIATKPTGNQANGIWMAVRQGPSPGNTGADRDGYQIEIDTSTTGADLVLIYKKTDGVGTELARTTAVTFSAGDKIGFRVSGTSSTLIEVFRFTGGSWNQTPILTVTDSSTPYTAAGSMSFGMTDTNGGPGRIDDIFYGTLVASGGATVTAPPIAGAGDVPNPALAAGAAVMAAPAVGLGDMPLATSISAEAGAAPAVGTGAMPAPAVSGGGAADGTVVAPVIDGVGDVPNPTVAADAAVVAPVMDGTGDIAAPVTTPAAAGGSTGALLLVGVG